MQGEDVSLAKIAELVEFDQAIFNLSVDSECVRRLELDFTRDSRASACRPIRGFALRS